MMIDSSRRIIHLACIVPLVYGFVAPQAQKSVIQRGDAARDKVIKRFVDDSDGFGSSQFESSYQTKFDKMQAFESRLEVLERGAPTALTNFYEPHLKSFSVKPGSVQRLSITSTCYALQTMMSASDSSLYDSAIIRDMSPLMEEQTGTVDSRVSVRSIVRGLLQAEWREEDLFQVPLLLHTVLAVDKGRSVLGPSMDEALAAKVRKLVEAVLSARPQRRFGANQKYSDYIQFLCCQAYATLYGSTEVPTAPGIREQTTGTDENETGVAGLPQSALPEGAASQLSLALARSAEVCYNELCRQLAYRSAEDVTSFDVIRLGCSLLGYVTACDSLSGTAGRELVRGAGPSPGTKVGPPNRRLVVAALAAFFAEQNDDGLWDKGQPIYKSFRRSGRNVGNAFVFVTDTLGCLLEKLPPEDFRPHLDALQRTLKWIESHQILEVIPDYCDPESGQCYGKALRGWSSPHLTQDVGPLSWSTAQTLTCVSRMRSVIRALQHSDVLAEFKGVARTENVPKLAAWNRLLDTDLGPCGGGPSRTLKDVLEERVITPFSASSSSPSYGAAYSAILFGPPGTAKTTICEALAERMGWDFLVIDTAAFLADGLTNVAARIRYVFERLQALERCIILFDEIEEFCLDRETPGLGMESRMLTTAMLTAINDLRRAKRSIFFLATNRLRAFDSAITRPGRFDMQLFVGTPNLEARCIQLRQKLAAVAASEERKQEAEETYRAFLESVWTKDAMFMNYLEGMQFATACANIVASGAELTEEEMGAILETQAAVMTARGTVREEYLASMEMSRL